MLKKISKVLLVFTSLSMFTFAENVDDIIKKIDYNQAPESVIYTAKMAIHKDNKTTEKELKIYGKGKNKTFVEFNAPARDKGTRYLRLETNLWMYLPSAEKTVKIAGHMLRQGMMGSDFSYEDQTERMKFFENYTFSIEKEDTLNDRKVYVMNLEAKPNIEITYYKRKIWVDKEQYTILQSEMYAKSGKLLKTLSQSDIKKIGNRYYPTHMKMEDKIKGDSYSEIFMTNIELDKNISEDTFTLKNVERKN